MSEGFRFRKFYVKHDRSSMPVGTDAVLLGAWCPLESLVKNICEQEHSFRVLDIGTGSGVIALMLAQRIEQTLISNYIETHNKEKMSWHIDAIDIDPLSVEQSKDNFAHSLWCNHLASHQCRVQDWQGNYDLIVVNPPFFIDSLHNPNPQRAAARQSDIALPVDELMEAVGRLLSPMGLCTLIIPAIDENKWMVEAEKHNLRLSYKCEVRGKKDLPVKRLILTLNHPTHHNPFKSYISHIVLTDEKNRRTDEYYQLTRDFYL